MFLSLNATGQPNYFPHMYTNTLAFFALNNIDVEDYWNPFKYYDLFSLIGMMDWLWDTFLLFWFPWWELTVFLLRLIADDWQFL